MSVPVRDRERRRGRARRRGRRGAADAGPRVWELLAMKPVAFRYERPESVEEAVALLAEHGDEAKVLAGGQSLVPMLNMRLARPVGARRRQPAAARRDRARERLLARRRDRAPGRPAPARDPAPRGGLPVRRPLRRRATAARSAARSRTRTPRAELPLALTALGGSVVTSAGRTISAEEFFVTHFTTALEPDELLVETIWPAAEPDARYAFEEFALRHGDFALCMTAAVAAARRPARRARRRSSTGRRCSRSTRTRPDASARRAGRAVRATLARLARTTTRQLRRACSVDARSLERRAARDRRCTVNGRRYREEVEPRLLLSDFLRHTLGLTGTHVGCEHGVCGACTVRLDGVAVRSCLLLAVQADGAEIADRRGARRGARCRRRSARTTRSSAASARPGSCWPRPTCSSAAARPRARRSWTCSPGTSAGARATSRSSRRSRRRRRRGEPRAVAARRRRAAPGGRGAPRHHATRSCATRAARIAGGLGLERGERLATVLDNRVETALLYWAAQWVGRVVRPALVARRRRPISTTASRTAAPGS